MEAPNPTMDNPDNLVPDLQERAQPSIPTPAEMVKQEQELLKQQAQPEKPKAPETPKEEKKDPTDEQLLVLKAKIESGTKPEEMTPEEQAILAAIDKEIEIPAPTVYRIDGQEIPYEEARKQMLEYNKLTPETKLGEDAEKILVESYVKIANQKAANKSIDTGFKENAVERQRLGMERVRLEQAAQNLLQQQSRMIEARKKQDIILAKKISEDELYHEDGRVDAAKLEEYTAQRQALREAPELDAEIKNIEKDIRSTQRNLDLATLNEFVYSHPEYRTKEPIEIVAQKMLNNDPTVDPEDKIKVREMNEFLVTSDPQRGVTIEDNYQFNMRRGSLAVKPPVHTEEMPNKTKIPTLPKPQTMLQKVELFRQNANRKTPGGKGSGAPVHQPTPTRAREMIEHAHGILGVNSGDQFLKEFNY